MSCCGRIRTSASGSCTAATRRRRADATRRPVGQLAVLDQFVVVILGVVDDPQDLDEAEGGSQPPQGRLLVGVDLSHGPARLAPRRLVPAGAKMQVDPATLEFELVDLTLSEEQSEAPVHGG